MRHVPDGALARANLPYERDHGRFSYRKVVPPLAPNAPANRYATMKASECRVEARRRRLPLSPVDRRVPAVDAPFRLKGKLNGVRLEVPHPKSPFGILDCRLALALDDMANVLAKLGVAGLHIDNMYRPRARVAGKGTPSQHAYGLAADVLSMTLGDTEVVVKNAWRSRLGNAPCGPASLPSAETGDALTMRNAVCEVARRGLFHHVLTPNHNEAHGDHFHFDLEAGEKALLVK